MTAARDLLKRHASLFESARRGDLDGQTYTAELDGAAYSLPDTLKTVQRELRKVARSNKYPSAHTLRDLEDILARKKGETNAQD